MCLLEQIKKLSKPRKQPQVSGKANQNKRAIPAIH
jgi:hypothetical protein